MTTAIITKICSICKIQLPCDQYASSVVAGKRYARSECRPCFNRLRREAPIDPRLLPPERIELFWSYVLKTDKCWIWQGRSDSNGYGRFSLGRPMVLAHRFSAMLIYPGLKTSTHVLHECDNPPCVNPDHFMYGTQVDNVADMMAKNRQAKGACHSQAKLTEADILKIREYLRHGKTQIKIARIFHVSPTAISNIHTGKYWSHI